MKTDGRCSWIDPEALAKKMDPNEPNDWIKIDAVGWNQWKSSAGKKLTMMDAFVCNTMWAAYYAMDDG